MITDLHGYSLIVTGFPRSGTSMMMRMLELGGIELLYDIGPSETINHYDPYGVRELKSVGDELKNHPKEWTANKAVKVVAPFWEWFPVDRPLKAIFMLRDRNEIITSLLAKRDIWAYDIDTTVASARAFLEYHNVPTLFLWYKEALNYPKTTSLRVQEFLDVELDIAKMVTGADKKVRDRINPDKESRILSMNVKDYEGPLLQVALVHDVNSAKEKDNVPGSTPETGPDVREGS